MRFTQLRWSQGRTLGFESLESRDMLSGAQVDSWTEPVVLGDSVIFVASDAEYGKELWITNGTESGTRLLKDINSGTGDSNPSQLTLCGNVVYFTAKTSANGTELWKTDGTASGTVLVKDIYPGTVSSNPDKLTAVGSTLFFIAETAANGTELWKSDGTNSGTTLVIDIWPGSNSGCGWSSELCAVGSTLFFSAQTADGNYELWKSNGTSSGTTQVKDIRPGVVGSYPAEMIAVGSTLYFTADDGSTGTELWKSDGTANGTSLVKDIRSGSASSTPTHLTLLGTTLYFAANDGSNGVELWKSDGTASGTMLLKDIYSGVNSSQPSELTVFGNAVYFTANNGVNGVELWKTDGTPSGTVILKDIRPGSTSSNPKELTVLGSTLYFTANDGIKGTELWKTDGTSNGTVIVKDIRPGTLGSNPFHLTPYKGKLLFAATDNYDSSQLFLSDGTATGTNRIIPYKELPTAIFDTMNLSIQQGGKVLLSAAGSIDPLGEGLVYLWDFYGHGVFQETIEPTIIFSTMEVNAKSNTRHTVYLKVRDAAGDESPVVQTGIYVQYLAPNYSLEYFENELYAKNSSRWTFTAADQGRQGIVSWAIDWGDGSAKTEILGGPRNQVEVFRTFSNPGKYGITVTTTDTGGITTTVSLGSYVVAAEKANLSTFVAQSVSVSEIREPQESQTQIIDVSTADTPITHDTVIPTTGSATEETRSLEINATENETHLLRFMLDLDQRADSENLSTESIDDFWNSQELFETDSIVDFAEKTHSDLWNNKTKIEKLLPQIFEADFM